MNACMRAHLASCCSSCIGALSSSRRAADEAALRTIIAKFATAKGFPAIEAVVRELARPAIRRSRRPLAALADGNLYVRKSDAQVFVGKEAGASVSLLDPMSGEPAGEAAKADITKIKVNNRLRRVIRDALGTLTLGAPDPAVRLAAAETMFRKPDPAAIAPLDAAIAKETDAKRQGAARAGARRGRAGLRSRRRPTSSRRSTLIGARGDREALSLLTSFEAIVRRRAEGRRDHGDLRHQ